MQNLDPSNPPPSQVADKNRTVASANEATGVAPLNAGPTEPQAPQHAPIDDQIPPSLASLPSGCEAVVFPFQMLEDRRQARNEIHTASISHLPDASQMEDLVQAKMHPSGPVRAEDLGLEGWRDAAGVKYSDVLGKVADVVEDGRVGVYKVFTGLSEVEHYIVGLDVKGERVLGVRILGLGG